MDFGEDNNVAEHSSTFEGAIFMSNRMTKKECLSRKLFGLPPAQAPFVKNVKAGMLLFLFEYEERKLYGVFEASSDGAMNIEPNAFSSSGKSFSAQIRFKRVWLCHPLSEDEFCDSIKDNYYTLKKFHFFLSEEQVSKLIWLFSVKKINPRHSWSVRSGDNAENHPEYYGLVRSRDTTERSVSSDIISDDFTVNNERELVRLNSYSNSPRHKMLCTNYFSGQVLNTEDSKLEDQRELSLTVPRTSNPVVSDLTPAASRNDAFVVRNFLGPASHMFPSFCYSQSSSHARSSLDLKSNSIQELGVYSRSSWGSLSSLLPLSCGQQHQSRMEAETLDLSCARYCHMKNISTNPEDGDLYFPPERRVEPHEPSIPYTRDRDFERKCIDLNDSSSPADDEISCIPAGSRVHCNEPSTLVFPDLEAEKFEKVTTSSRSCPLYMHGYNEDVALQHRDGHEGQDIPLCFDVCKTRASVFSRLSAPETSVQGDETETDMSVIELLGLLAMRRKQRLKMKKARETFIGQDTDKVNQSEGQATSGIALGDEAGSCVEGDMVEDFVKPFFVNFRRRSESQKRGSEKGASLESGESEGSSGKPKRRKLIRPSFSNEKSSGETNSNARNAKLSCQELGDDHGLIRNAQGGGNAAPQKVNAVGAAFGSEKSIGEGNSTASEAKLSSLELGNNQESIKNAEEHAILSICSKEGENKVKGLSQGGDNENKLSEIVRIAKASSVVVEHGVHQKDNPSQPGKEKLG